MTYHRSFTPIFAAPAVQHDGRPALQLYVPVTVPLVYDHALAVPGYGHMECHRSRTPVDGHHADHRKSRDSSDKHRRKSKDKDKARDARNSRDDHCAVEEKREKRRDRESGDSKRERRATTPTPRPRTPTHGTQPAASHLEPRSSSKRSSHRHELPGPPNSPVDEVLQRPPSRSRQAATPSAEEPRRWKALPEVPAERGRRRTVSPAPIMQRQSSWERLQRLTRPRPAAGPMAARHESRHYHESTIERSLRHMGFGERYLVPSAGPPAMSLAPSRNPNRHRETSLERGIKYLGLGESRDRHGYRRLDERQSRAHHRVPPPARTSSVERAIGRVFGGRARSPHHHSARTPTRKKRSKSTGPPKRVHFADGTVPGQRR